MMKKTKMLIVIPMLAILMPLVWVVGTEISIAIQEGMTMKTTILIIIFTLGLLVPLMWFIGTVTAMIYFYLHPASSASEERTVPLHSQLGLTMADGGDAIEKEEKG
jgi:hypothetical protein